MYTLHSLHPALVSQLRLECITSKSCVNKRAVELFKGTFNGAMLAIPHAASFTFLNEAKQVLVLFKLDAEMELI